MNNPEIFQKVVDLIERNEFSYELLEHEHVHGSEDAAKTRGTKLEEAVKALVLKCTHKKVEHAEASGVKDGEFILCAVSGHRRVDLNKLKHLLGCRHISLAHPDEVFEVTGCKVGTITPWPVVFGIKGFADKDILENEFIVFSLASHHKSIRMKSADWLRISGSELQDIAKT